MQQLSLLDIPTSIINYLYHRFFTDEKTCRNFGLTCRAFSIIRLYDIRYKKIANFIRYHFNIIDCYPKNIPLSQIVQFSKLIMLGEDHTNTEQRILNDCLTSVLWIREKNCLLLEGKGMGNCLSKEIKHKAQIWDKGFLKTKKGVSSIEKYKEAIVKNLFSLFKEMRKKLTIILNSNKFELNPCKLFSYQKKLNDLLSKFSLKYNSIDEMMHSIQGPRNWHLLNGALREIRKKKMPILFAGSGHVTDGVVLQELKRKKINFISLVPLEKETLDFTDKKVQTILNLGDSNFINHFYYQALVQRKNRLLNEGDCNQCYSDTFSMLDDMIILQNYSKETSPSSVLPSFFQKLKHAFFHFDIERINSGDEHVGAWVDLGYTLLTVEKKRIDLQIEKFTRSKI